MAIRKGSQWPLRAIIAKKKISFSQVVKNCILILEEKILSRDRLMRKNLFLTDDALDLNWFLRPYFTLIGSIFSIFFGTGSAQTESEKNATF